MDMSLDPDQKARRRLERKLVISGVKRHGRMTKAQKLLRTERQSLYRSQLLPTSTKKLQKVVNQIAGKTVSEALVQLRFSPKRVARDVIKGLEIAQNEAIAARGMGLAGEDAAVSRWKKQRAATDAGRPKDTWDYKTSKTNGSLEAKPVKVPFFKDTTIQLKDGSKKVVRDPSEIYIDQAWVGPGQSWKTPEFRARGAINMLKHRTTSEFVAHFNLDNWALTLLDRFLRSSQGREDALAHLRRDSEEARQPQAVDRTSRPTRHITTAILPVVNDCTNSVYSKCCQWKKTGLYNIPFKINRSPSSKAIPIALSGYLSITHPRCITYMAAAAFSTF